MQTKLNKLIVVNNKQFKTNKWKNVNKFQILIL